MGGLANTLGSSMATQICKPIVGLGKDCIGRWNILRVRAMDMATTNAILELCDVYLRCYLYREVLYLAQGFVGRCKLTLQTLQNHLRDGLLGGVGE
jgi:hypothetical protein